jgi:cobalt-zinc-cadmium efflux system outer membrane protein
MNVKPLMPAGIVLFVALHGCAAERQETVWPEPRPLGREVPVSRAPAEPAPISRLPVEEPTGVLRLEDVLRAALLRNPELSATAFGVRTAEARALQAGLLPNPELELELENFGGTGEVRGMRAAESTVQLSQLVELGGKRAGRLRAAGLERDLAGWDYEAKRLEVLTEATKAFVNVLAAQERLALTEDIVRLSEQVVNAAVERIRAGKVPPVEATKARVEAANARLQVEHARSALQAARAHLSASWGGTRPAFEGVHGSLEGGIAAVPSPEELITRLAQNPDLARWAIEMEARQAALRVERSKRIPNVTLSGGVRYFNDTDDTGVVVKLSLPLVFFDYNQGAVLEARHRLSQAEEERRAAEVRLSAALAEAYQSLITGYRDVTGIQRDVLPAAEEAFQVATEGYRQGKFGFLDVLDAQRTLFETKGQYLDALSAYHKAVADTERLIGEPLGAVTNRAEAHHQGKKR